MTRLFKHVKRLLLSAILIASLTLNSCVKEYTYSPKSHVDQTLIMFFPWAGLTSYFNANINDMMSGLNESLLSSSRVFYCLQTAKAGKCEIYEIYYHKNLGVQKNFIKTYTSIDFTQQENITMMLDDIASQSSSDIYTMTVSAHGLGWLPADESSVSVSKQSAMNLEENPDYNPNGTPLLTRWFGTEYGTQIELTTLREAILDSKINHLEYLLFDACYMSNVESAYELRDITNYYIACPTEILAYGYPYSSLAKYMIGNIDYQAIVDTFYDFYSTYVEAYSSELAPYATIGITDCSEFDDMTSIMREINEKYEFEYSLFESQLQIMDGYYPTVFYDMGSYVSELCFDGELQKRFDEQLAKLVPYSAHTGAFYSALTRLTYPIKTYTGLTISDPTTNSKIGAASAKYNTSWWKDTHTEE